MSEGTRKVKDLSKKKNPLPILIIAYTYIGKGRRNHMECHIHHESTMPEEKSSFSRAIIESVLIAQPFQIDK